MSENRNREVNVVIKAKQLFDLGEDPAQLRVDELSGFDSNEIVDGHWVNDSWKSHAEYELSVYKNHTILWFIPQPPAKDENAGYETKLLGVYHNPNNGSPNIFDTDMLPVGPDGKIKGTISKDSNQEYIYTVKFSITHNGQTRKYSIDPKLIIKT